MRDVMAEEKDEEYSALKINGRKISDLRYADDTALLSTTPTGLNKLVKSVKKKTQRRQRPIIKRKENENNE